MTGYTYPDLMKRVEAIIRDEGMKMPKNIQIKVRDQHLEVDSPLARTTLFKDWLDIPQEKLAQEIARIGFVSLRRERNLVGPNNKVPTWSLMGHPLALALAHHIGFKRDHYLPARRSPEEIEYPYYKYQFMLETKIDWDIMSVTIATFMDSGKGSLPVRLETRPYWNGQCSELRVHISLPDTILASLPGKRLLDVIEIPKTGQKDIDDKVEGIRIGHASQIQTDPPRAGDNGKKLLLKLERTTWIPWGILPEAERQLFELSAEVL